MQWNAVPDSIRQEIEDTRAVPLIYVLGIIISLAHVYFNIFADIAVLQQNILHFAGFILLCGLLKPLSSQRHLAILDKLWVLAIAFSAIYLLFAEDLIYERGVRLVPLDWLCGSLVILGAIDMTRRATGWVIPILIVTAIS